MKRALILLSSMMILALAAASACQKTVTTTATIIITPLASTVTVTATPVPTSLTFTGDLTGANEVPAVTTAMTAHVEITFNPTRTQATYKLTVTGGVGVTGAHFHVGAPGFNGPVVVTLFSQASGMDINGTLSEGTLTDASASGAITSLAALANAMSSGTIYCNVHTLVNPGGAIRVQMHS